MYDFSFGDKKQILDNQEDFLIFCKRLLPRWINGIPDSECLSIYRTLKKNSNSAEVLIETGCGASSLAMFLHAALTGGQLYSWDTNGSKGSFLRSVISDSICRVLDIDLHKVWKFISFDSTNPYVGIRVMEELNLNPSFGFFDSWHTLDHLMKEINNFEFVAANKFIIALDDAYYSKKYENFSYINMLRKKLSLNVIEEPEDNVCKPFYIEVEKYLKSKYKNVKKINDSYKNDYKDDIFFNYYNGDRMFINELGMEQKEELEHRFDAWQVIK